VKPVVLAGLLASLIVVPLFVIGFFALVGRIFSAPRRFGSILFVILFIAALGGAAFGYYRAGEVVAATVTSTSERVVVDGDLRARHEFTLTAQLPGADSTTIEVPGRVFDRVSTGSQLDIRHGSLLGIQLARAEREHLSDLMPLGTLACAIGVVLVTALAASARRARAPAVLVMLALLAGTGVQPAIHAVGPGGTSAQSTATVTGSSPVWSQRAPGVAPLGYLRGPVSLDQRWLWSNGQQLRFVAVTFVPAGRTTPVTAVDVVPAASAIADGQQVSIRYRVGDPREIRLAQSRTAIGGWILLGLLAVIGLLLIAAAVLLFRMRRRSERRRRAREQSLSRDPGVYPGLPAFTLTE
jgi:hypothetical protein